MKATLEELRSMFKLSDFEFRQLKVGLKNKIMLVDADNVSITDTNLGELLTKFRKSGAMTRKEVCSTYKITLFDLTEMVKCHSIPYYQLRTGRGSQWLFLKSELEKEKELFLTPVAKVRKRKMEVFVQTLVSVLEKERHLSEREREIFTGYYMNGRSEEEIGLRYGLNPDSVLQILTGTQSRLLRRFEKFIASYASFQYTAFELNKMEEENIALKKMVETISNYIKMHKNNPERMKFLETPLRDLDLEVRAKNCLLAADVNTVMELLKYSKTEMLKFRNFGQKSLREIEQFLLKNDIVW